MIPFLDRLNAGRCVLIAGCGGGFDVFSGVPIGTYLVRRGCQVTYANYSLSALWDSGGTQVDDVTWLVDEKAASLAYFPEKVLAEWLLRHGWPAPVYAFDSTGARPLARAYKSLCERHAFDLVVLVDGGTDSLIFGDEPGLGTVLEDAISIVAACEAAGDRAVLASLGFGVDHYHGVSHHSFLENAARLMREDGYLGGFSLVKGTVEAEAFLDLIDYANQRQPEHRSIVCNSIAAALRGEFGDVHGTDRTSDNELFINPLMTQYWTFEAQRVRDCMLFADALAQTDTLRQGLRAIETARQSADIRLRRPIPL